MSKSINGGMNSKNRQAIKNRIILVTIAFTLCACDNHDFTFDEEKQTFYVYDMLGFYIEPDGEKELFYSYDIKLKEKKKEKGIDTLGLNNISSKYQVEACFPNIDTVINNPKRAVLAPKTRYRVLHMGMGRVYGIKYYHTDSVGRLRNEEKPEPNTK